jgi:hypothetical protein
MTRNGKIARLPYSIRDRLNQRLHNGEHGTKLVKWLNGLPEVQEVLTKEFGGHPINKQNLSEWKQGGFEDWLRHQEARAWMREMRDEAADLEEDAGDYSVADWLSAPLGLALGRWMQRAAAKAENDPEQRRTLLSVARELNQLRRGDHEEQSLRIERERWQAEQAATEAEKRSAAKWSPLFALLTARGVVDLYREDLENGKIPAELKAFFAATAKARKTQNGPGDCKPQEIPQADQTESNPIQPNQTNANKTR